MADHQGAEALMRAAEVLEREARGLKHSFCCAHSGKWSPDESGARQDHDEMLALAKTLRAWNRRPAPAHLVDANKMVAAGGDGLPELPEQVARVYWTLHDGPHVGWHSYKAMNAAILEGYQPEKPLFTADQMRQYYLDALAARAEKAPLSDKQIIRAWLDCTEPGCSATDAFVAGIRFAEKHHGIAPPSDSAAEGGGEDRE